MCFWAFIRWLAYKWCSFVNCMTFMLYSISLAKVKKHVLLVIQSPVCFFSSVNVHKIACLYVLMPSAVVHTWHSRSFMSGSGFPYQLADTVACTSETVLLRWLLRLGKMCILNNCRHLGRAIIMSWRQTSMSWRQTSVFQLSLCGDLHPCSIISRNSFRLSFEHDSAASD